MPLYNIVIYEGSVFVKYILFNRKRGRQKKARCVCGLAIPSKVILIYFLALLFPLDDFPFFPEPLLLEG